MEPLALKILNGMAYPVDSRGLSSNWTSEVFN